MISGRGRLQRSCPWAWCRKRVAVRAIAQAVGNGTPLLMGGLGRLLGEGGPDGGGDHRSLRGPDVGQRIPHEVHAAALTKSSSTPWQRLPSGLSEKRNRPRASDGGSPASSHDGR